MIKPMSKCSKFSHLSCFLIVVLCGMSACKSTPEQVKKSAPVEQAKEAAQYAWSDIAMTTNQTCAVRGPELWCWHAIDAEGNAVDKLDATMMSRDVEYADLKANAKKFCGLDSKNVVSCWDENAHGSLVMVSDPAQPIKMFDISDGLICTLSAQNQVMCSEWSEDSKVGADLFNKIFEQPVSDLQVGDTHACALLEDRSVECWKTGASTMALVPKNTDDEGDMLTNIASMAVGEDYICTSRDDGERMACWGGMFSSDDAKSNAQMLNAHHPQAFSNVVCMQDYTNKMRCSSKYDYFQPASLQLFKYMPEMLVQEADAYKVSGHLSDDTFAIRPYTMCAIGLDQQLRCYDWRGDITSAKSQLKPHKINGISDVEQILAVEKGTLIRTSDHSIQFVGIGEIHSNTIFDGALYSEEMRHVSVPDPNIKHTIGNIQLVPLKATDMARKINHPLFQVEGSGWKMFRSGGLAPVKITMEFPHDTPVSHPSLVPPPGEPVLKDMHLEEEDLWVNQDTYWHCALYEGSDTKLYCDSGDNYAVAPIEGPPTFLVSQWNPTKAGSRDRGLCLRFDTGDWYCINDYDYEKIKRKFVKRNDLDDITELYMLSSMVCKLDENKTLTCTPYDGNPELSLKNVSRVRESGRTLCAITTSNDVFCLGANNYELIVPKTNNKPWVVKEFTKIEGLKNIVDVSFANDHACAIDTNKELWCWGDNSVGQLGEPSPFIRTVQFPQ